MNSADLSGNDFVVMFNRDKLQQLQSEDELAFILAHELSHLGWQHGDSEIRGLHGNEEAACDINALKMTDAAGYNVRVVENMDRHVPSSPEWQQRKEARRQTMMYMFSRENAETVGYIFVGKRSPCEMDARFSGSRYRYA